MRTFAVPQGLLGCAVLVVSPVASEASLGLTVWLAATGVLAVVGAVGLWREARWGRWLSIVAHAAFALPIAGLAVAVARDLRAGRASFDSAGVVYFIPMLLVPTLAIVYLARRLH